jgi:hypothetical protein
LADYTQEGKSPLGVIDQNILKIKGFAIYTKGDFCPLGLISKSAGADWNY